MSLGLPIIFVASAGDDLNVHTWFNAPTRVRRGTVREDGRLDALFGTYLSFREVATGVEYYSSSPIWPVEICRGSSLAPLPLP